VPLFTPTEKYNQYRASFFTPFSKTAVKNLKMAEMNNSSIRTQEIMDENLSIDLLVSRIVQLELDLKFEKCKSEDGQLFVALEAVKLQKRSDPSFIDVISNEYIETLNGRYSVLFLLFFSVSTDDSYFFRKTTMIANKYSLKTLKASVSTAIGNTVKADEVFEAGFTLFFLFFQL